MRRISLGERWIGDNAPCFIVAELSANHGQDLSRAKESIKAAKKAGADAVKLQTYTPATMTIDSDQTWFQVPSNSIWAGKTLHELYEEAHTPWEWHQELFDLAKAEGLVCFSTPFDKTAVDFLEDLSTPLYKIASFEMVDLALLKTIAETKKPVIMSTGMASFEEITEAVATLTAAESGPLILLKCTSAYPASPNSMNLKTMVHLRDSFNTLVGLSDHTLNHIAAMTAVALGAAVIEKHFTLSRGHHGPDASFSLEPHEFASLVAEIRSVEAVLGKISYERMEEEEKNICFRRSLFVVKDIKAGEFFSTENVQSIRPGYGLSPRHLAEVLGKKATKTVKRGTPLSWDLIGEWR